MKNIVFIFFISVMSFTSCKKKTTPEPKNPTIEGFDFLSKISGHWIGTNKTVYGNYPWFTFDFRPISASHVHSIYEGATNQNIINAFFIADYNGKKQLMGRNGGWLGSQYRATYFTLDKIEKKSNSTFYRFVDAIGGVKRSYMTFEFTSDSMFFDAYKDNSGMLDDPIHHMGFRGTNVNPAFDDAAKQLFQYPQEVVEVNLNGKMTSLVDPGSALFLDEGLDPFPKSMHGHISDLTVNFTRDVSVQNDPLVLYISKEPIIESGLVNAFNLDTKLMRLMDIDATETSFTTTYLHPDTYYIMAFSDKDNNKYPSAGDVISSNVQLRITPNSVLSTNVTVDTVLP